MFNAEFLCSNNKIYLQSLNPTIESIVELVEILCVHMDVLNEKKEEFKVEFLSFIR